jgi:hypothetical protein
MWEATDEGSSGSLAGDLLSNQAEGYPELGGHRIQAAPKFLSPKDKWWAVKLYLAGMEIPCK